MNKCPKKNGSVLILAVFAIAIITTLAAGMLQLSYEQIQLMQNQLYATEAFEISQAGLNSAFAQIRDDPNWNTGFAASSFAYGSFTVDVNNTDMPAITIRSVGTNNKGYSARITANCIVADQGPAAIRIAKLTVNK